MKSFPDMLVPAGLQGGGWLDGNTDGCRTGVVIGDSLQAFTVVGASTRPRQRACGSETLPTQIGVVHGIGSVRPRNQ